MLLAVSLLKESVTTGRTGWVAATALVLFGFLGKLGYELATSQTLFVDSAEAGMVPIPLAHLIGGVIGAAIAIWPGAQQASIRSALSMPRTCQQQPRLDELKSLPG